MIRTVCPAYLGCGGDFYQTAPLIAAQGGFSGYYSYDIQPDIARGAAETRRMFEAFRLKPTGFRLPVRLDASAALFEKAYAALPEIVRVAREAGYPAALTWIMPGSDTAPPLDYRMRLASRLERLAGLLAEYEMRLAVELVAPYTLQQQYRFPIPATLGYLLSLIKQTGMENVGAVLDVFHFYCAGHTGKDYQLLENGAQVVMVHVSDGVAGRQPCQQLDQDRRLPGESGVIDCGPLMARLVELGYTGSVVPEPIDDALRARPFSETLRRASEALDRIWPPEG